MRGMSGDKRGVRTKMRGAIGPMLTLIATLATMMAAELPARAQDEALWTVLIYLNGDADTAGEDASISDFNELERVGSTANVNLVVQWDRGTAPDALDTQYPLDTSQSWTGTRRYLVTKDPNQNADPDALTPADAGYRIASTPLLDLGEVDMYQENSLVQFVSWALTRFPAQNTMLIIADPAQRLDGVGIDFTSAGGSVTNAAAYFTWAELRSALARIQGLNGGDELAALVLDTGYSARVEAAYEVAEYVDYLVGNYLFRPGDGAPYDVWMQTLIGGPPNSVTALETLLTTFATTYTGSYLVGGDVVGAPSSVATAVVRLQPMDALATALDNLAGELLADLPTTISGILRALAATQRNDRLGLQGPGSTVLPGGYLTGGPLIDLSDFLAKLTNEFGDQPLILSAIQTAQEALGAAVVAASKSTVDQGVIVDVARFNGLGIYFPRVADEYDTAYGSFFEFNDDTAWDELVQGVLTIFSDQTPPDITISSPTIGATILQNPPVLLARIVDPGGGRIAANTIRLQLDGQTIAAADFTFDPDTGLLRYEVPRPLSAASHVFTIRVRDLSGNEAVASGNFRIAVPTLERGVQTFSLPRTLPPADADPALVFGEGNFGLIRWVPFLSGFDKYRRYPDPYATFRPPDAGANVSRPTVPAPPAGLGYWVRLLQSRPLTSLPGTPVTASQYPIRLYADPAGTSAWNLIANPYDVAAVGLASTQVQTSDGRVISFMEAVDRRITTGFLFSYIPNTANLNAPGRYEFADAGEGQLVRLQAHWLKANQDFTLIVRSAGANTGGVGRAVSRDTGSTARPTDGWLVELVVRHEQGAAEQPMLGVSRQASDGFDSRWDVDAPPAMPEGLSARFVHTDWQEADGRYVRDVRHSADTGQSWALEVVAPAGEVSVAWPELRRVPGDVDLTLTDLDTGQRRLLRTSAGYTFQHRGGRRMFTVQAARRTQARLMLSEVNVTPGRSGALAVGYTLNQPADVQVVVRGLAGQTVRQLTAPGQTLGRSSLVWDGRDASGHPVPNGVYRVEVIAQTPDGAVARQVRAVRVLR